MLLKALFSKARDLTPDQARQFMRQRSPAEYTLLDVRQPREYEREHIPGGKLVPLPQLGDRMAELDPKKPVIAYCAVGGRSRAAAEMLAGRGFGEVYSLKGGIRAWNGQVALGPESQGLGLLTGREDRKEALVVALGLEEGLRRFYQALAPRAQDQAAGELCLQLAEVELRHQDLIWDLYQAGPDGNLGREEFARLAVGRVMEGGETVEEALAGHLARGFTSAELLAEAMGIEAQALDLYLRLAERLGEAGARGAFLRLAQEEQAHLDSLGRLLDHPPA
ncbi:MAG: hypothetical protein LDL07_10390 [Desulfarculus sp.]|nr:hypothetical protein [Desulfarculus sp.]